MTAPATTTSLDAQAASGVALAPIVEPKPSLGGARSGASLDRADRINPYAAHRRLLPPQRVRELSKLRPWRTIRDTAWCWLGIIAGWTLVAIYPTWWAVLIAVPLIGTRYYGLFIIGHDGMHRRIFNSRKSTELFCDLLVLAPIGMITRINDRNHLLHHQHLATDDDPDLHKHACFNKSNRLEYVLFLSGLSSVIAVLRNLFVKPVAVVSVPADQYALNSDDSARASEDASTSAKQPERATAKTPYTLRDIAIVLCWQLALITGLTLTIGWWAYPVLWLMPVYLFAYLPNLIRSFIEHAHPEDDDVADHHRLTTFLSNPVERLLFAPMNMNYHIAHHLWPSIPYYNLPRADRELHAAASESGHLGGDSGLIWRGGYFAYMWKYYVALPVDECRNSRQRKRHGLETDANVTPPSHRTLPASRATA